MKKSIISDGEIESIQGYLMVKEFKLLETISSYFHKTERIDVVEIGAFCGKSTTAIALGLQTRSDSSYLYSIDWHQGSPEHREDEKFQSTLEVFRQNLQKFGVSSCVKEVIGRSEDVVNLIPEQIDILWIDGQHDYESVKQDFFLYEKKVKQNGIILFHDAYKVDVWTGPLKLICQDILLSRNDYELFVVAGTIIGLRKQENNTSKIDIDILSFLNYERCKNSRIFRRIDKILDKYILSKYKLRL